MNPWQHVADEINARMEAIPIDQAELVRRAGVSDPTVRGLMRGKPRADSPRTGPLRKIAVALGWTPDSIDRILAGGHPRLASKAVGRDVESRLAAVESELESVSEGLRELSEAQRDLAEMAHTHEADGRVGSTRASSR